MTSHHWLVLGDHPLSPPGGPPFLILFLRKIVTNSEAEVETKGS